VAAASGDEYLVRISAKDQPNPRVEDAVRRRVRRAGGRVVFVTVLGGAVLRAVFYLRARSQADASDVGQAIVSDGFAEAGLEADEIRERCVLGA
jgi:hypothetical protein